MKIWKGTLLHSTDSEKVLLRLVQTILADPDNPSVPQLEAEINQLVYALYNLAPGEIRMIGDSTKL